MFGSNMPTAGAQPPASGPQAPGAQVPQGMLSVMQQSQQVPTQQGTGITPQLIDVLAEQKLTEEKQHAAIQLALASGAMQQPTVAQTLRNNLMRLTKAEVARDNGLVGLQSNLPTQMAGGGIVAFAEGGTRGRSRQRSISDDWDAFKEWLQSTRGVPNLQHAMSDEPEASAAPVSPAPAPSGGATGSWEEATAAFDKPRGATGSWEDETPAAMQPPPGPQTPPEGPGGLGALRNAQIGIRTAVPRTGSRPDFTPEQKAQFEKHAQAQEKLRDTDVDAMEAAARTRREKALGLGHEDLQRTRRESLDRLTAAYAEHKRPDIWDAFRAAGAGPGSWHANMNAGVAKQDAAYEDTMLERAKALNAAQEAAAKERMDYAAGLYTSGEAGRVEGRGMQREGGKNLTDILQTREQGMMRQQGAWDAAQNRLAMLQQARDQAMAVARNGQNDRLYNALLNAEAKAASNARETIKLRLAQISDVDKYAKGYQAPDVEALVRAETLANLNADSVYQNILRELRIPMVKPAVAAAAAPQAVGTAGWGPAKVKK